MANTRCISYVRHKSGRNPFPVFCNVTEYYIQRDNDILSYHAHGPGYKTKWAVAELQDRRAGANVQNRRVGAVDAVLYSTVVV